MGLADVPLEALKPGPSLPAPVRGETWHLRNPDNFYRTACDRGQRPTLTGHPEDLCSDCRTMAAGWRSAAHS